MENDTAAKSWWTRFKAALAEAWARLDDPVDRMPTAAEVLGIGIVSAHDDPPATQDSRAAPTNGDGSKDTAWSDARLGSMIRDAGQAARSGGRVSFETMSDVRFAPGVIDFIQMGQDDQQSEDLFSHSERYIRSLRPSKLLELLSDASPEVGRALFDFMLMCCSGWELKGKQIGGTDLDQASNAYLNDVCIAKLNDTYGAPEMIFGKYFLSAFLRGSLASEIVLAPNGRDFLDIAPIDPDSLEHHRERDAIRGWVWRLYQRQGTELVDLNIPQVKYIPLHPFFGTNRGRALAKPAIFVCFFLIATLHDLRRVIRQQGYPRIDISVEVDKLRAMIPAAKQNDMAAIKTLADDIVSEVKSIYAALKPDDAFVHTNVVTINQPVGTLNASSLGVVGELLKALERMATRALKTMPLMMATTDGVSEANANRQWEIHVAGIKSIQHFAESILESHFNLALRARGLRGRAEFRFSELRAAELLRDAQVELLKTEVARQQYDNGSINADEMALKSAGKDKADVEIPRTSAEKSSLLGSSPGVTAAAGANADPGSGRAITFKDLVRMTLQDAAEAKDAWNKYAPAAAQGLLTAKPATEEQNV